MCVAFSIRNGICISICVALSYTEACVPRFVLITRGFYLAVNGVLRFLDTLPWWLRSKEFACNAGDSGSILGLRRSPGEGNGNPLQYSCLGNPMDRGGWWARVHEVTKESDMTEQLSTAKTQEFHRGC